MRTSPLNEHLISRVNTAKERLLDYINERGREHAFTLKCAVTDTEVDGVDGAHATLALHDLLDEGVFSYQRSGTWVDLADAETECPPFLNAQEQGWWETENGVVRQALSRLSEARIECEQG